MEELKSRSIPVTKTRSETRTRLVPAENGEQIEQSYIVEIPYTEMLEQYYTSYSLGPVERVTVPMDEIRAWRLDGSVIDSQSLGKLCLQPIHVFAAEMPLDAELGPVDPYFTSLIRSNALILYVAPGSLKPARAK